VAADLDKRARHDPYQISDLFNVLFPCSLFSIVEEALALLEQLPIKILPVDKDLVKEAAEIKSDYAVSYADAFCIALA
jgi:hypothetical protein